MVPPVLWILFAPHPVVAIVQFYDKIYVHCGYGFDNVFTGMFKGCAACYRTGGSIQHGGPIIINVKFLFDCRCIKGAVYQAIDFGHTDFFQTGIIFRKGAGGQEFIIQVGANDKEFVKSQGLGGDGVVVNADAMEHLHFYGRSFGFEKIARTDTHVEFFQFGKLVSDQFYIFNADFPV